MLGFPQARKRRAASREIRPAAPQEHWVKPVSVILDCHRTTLFLAASLSRGRGEGAQRLRRLAQGERALILGFTPASGEFLLTMSPGGSTSAFRFSSHVRASHPVRQARPFFAALAGS